MEISQFLSQQGLRSYHRGPRRFIETTYAIMKMRRSGIDSPALTIYLMRTVAKLLFHPVRDFHDEDKHIWNRLLEESSINFFLFCAYRDMFFARSITKVITTHPDMLDQMPEFPDGHKDVQDHLVLRRVTEMARKYFWTERANAYDDWLAEYRRREAVQKYLTIRLDYVEKLQEIHLKCYDRVILENTQDIPIRTALNSLVVVSDAILEYLKPTKLDESESAKEPEKVDASNLADWDNPGEEEAKPDETPQDDE